MIITGLKYVTYTLGALQGIVGLLMLGYLIFLLITEGAKALGRRCLRRPGTPLRTQGGTDTAEADASPLPEHREPHHGAHDFHDFHDFHDPHI